MSLERIAGLVAGVVRVTGQDGEGSVDLLGQEDASEMMRQGDPSEGEKKVCAFAGRIGPSVRWADREDESLGAGVAKVADRLG